MSTIQYRGDMRFGIRGRSTSFVYIFHAPIYLFLCINKCYSGIFANIMHKSNPNNS